MEYALIKNGVVEGVIVSDADYIAVIQDKYDACVRVDNIANRPGPGWTHSGGTTFVDPNYIAPGEPLP
jgi:hypothetical protein